MKVFGTLTIKFVNGDSISLQNVTNLNLINGIYYIWVLRDKSYSWSKKFIQEFYYSYTKY